MAMLLPNQQLGTEQSEQWRNGLVLEYEQVIKGRIPSDIPAYLAAYRWLRFFATGERILDLGCLTGDNTEFLLKEVNPREVYGLDVSPDSILRASEKYASEPRMKFITVGPDEQIGKHHGSFNAAFAGFVIPTISDKAVLQALFQKVSYAMQPGGHFIMLQLNPESLIKGGDYKFYKHRLPDNTHELRDGQRFHNKLISFDNHDVSFDDFIWTPTTLYRMLVDAGFINVSVKNLSDATNGEMGMQLSEAISQIEKDFNVKWGDEWNPDMPLYQLITAETPGTVEIDTISEVTIANGMGES